MLLLQVEQGFQPRGKNDAQQRILRRKPVGNRLCSFCKLSRGFNRAVKMMRSSASYGEKSWARRVGCCSPWHWHPRHWRPGPVCVQHVCSSRAEPTIFVPPGINSLLSLHKPVGNRLHPQSAGLLQVEQGFQPCGKNDAQQRIVRGKRDEALC
jgi:hypothetical protein